jgi:glycosyltransferase involved in cell wall biosynthesis
MRKFSRQKVAIVYDRVNKWGGAERVLLSLHEIFPKAPLFTSVYDNKKAPWAKVFPRVITSFLQNIPFTRSNHEFLAPFMPFVFESFDFSGYDLVISVTSEAGKGIRTGPDTFHLCYCLTPTRYLWSGYNDYFKNPIFKAITKPIIYILRIWDKKVAQRPDIMIAISTDVQKRIKKYYHRDSEVIFPPVNTLMNRIIEKNPKYYLLVSRLDYGYKKVDLAIKAFNRLGYPLVIIGTGREESRLKSMAEKNIRFVGKLSEKELIRYYRGAKALVMPQEEDFGIVSVEAQSYGVPVIAYKKGGAIDSVINGKTGIFFEKQNSDSLMNAIKKFEKTRFVVDNLYTNARKFSKKVFKTKILEQVSKINDRI